MEIKVRDYMEDDMESVNAILSEAFSCEKSSSTKGDFREIVATADGRVVGYLLLTKVFNPIRNYYYCLVDYVCVSKDYQGMSVGKHLLDYAYDVSKEEGARYLQLTCSRFRLAAHKLYEKCNFMKRDSDIYRKEIV